MRTFKNGAVRLVIPAFVIASLFSVSLLSGCASGPDASSDLVTSTPYRVGPSDTLTVKVLPDPAIELTALKVRPDGKVSVDLIGDVQAAGRTTDEISAEIAEKMAEFRQSPTVSVGVEAPTSTDMLLQKGDLVVVPAAYPVVAGYEIRKFLYPIEAFFRVIGGGLFLAAGVMN